MEHPTSVTGCMSAVAGRYISRPPGVSLGEQQDGAPSKVRQHRGNRGPLTPDRLDQNQDGGSVEPIFAASGESTPTARPGTTRGTEIPQSGEVAQRFYPGALVMPDPNCRVAHIILSVGMTGSWWFALCNRNGRTDGQDGDRAFIAAPGVPICAQCLARVAREAQDTSRG